jgi:hypothetical protein
VGCANYYTLLLLCPIIYLNYFWCIKYQHINICENWKKKWENEKEKEFQVNRARGVRPGRARGVAANWAQTAHKERGTARWTPWARARAPGRGGLMAWNGDGGREPDGGRPPVKSRGGSPPGVQFCDGGVVARHGQG